MSVPTTTPARLVFGREPAVISAAIMAAVALLSGFLTPISPTTQALIQTAVGAVLGLWVLIQVRENVVPGVLTLIQAVLPLAVVAGVDWTTEQQGLIYSSAAVILGLLARPNLNPKVIDGEVVPGSVRDEPLA
ncbi:hypothetical protein [Gordonia sp. OPL2]|uniref:hypothetical protein n=1 Tax=Gordonia sp. OPL2 TaxID=2486274 RepID=UPI001655E6B3|nr:hypothetical protein [Gordonia sp. OPL2]